MNNYRSTIEHARDHGVKALTNAQLIGLLIKGNSVTSGIKTAEDILACTDSLAEILAMPIENSMQRFGLSETSACTLAAVQELATRSIFQVMQTRTVLDNPGAVEAYLALQLRHHQRENFVALYLDNQHRLIRSETLFTGTLTQTAVYPREVLKQAIAHNAAAIILAHNHPSGHPEPSTADKMITRKLQSLLGEVDIRVLDHIIVAAEQQFSFSRNRLL